VRSLHPHASRVASGTKCTSSRRSPASPAGSPLKPGDVVRLTNSVHYDIDSDGRFARIRAGSFGEPTKNEGASLE
jgi:hypothetical protein